MAPFRHLVATTVRWIRGQEAIVLVAALAIALALLGFIKTTDKMLEGEMRSFDEWLLQTLRRQPCVAAPDLLAAT